MTITMSKQMAFGVLLLASTLFTACNSSSGTENNNSDSATVTHSDSVQHNGTATHAHATISGTYSDTTVDGSASFDQMDGKVKMVLNLTIPAKANKSVAVHLHEHGDCGDMGKGAHGHWNPTNKQHGKWGSDNFHSGDIGNVELDGQGKGSITLETALWSIGGDSTTNIINKAVIVHGGVDDYVSQPAGNAGDRIGCGVIQ
ncbi:MAG: superoxide dismutase family protein [Ginsengibacter sp.]